MQERLNLAISAEELKSSPGQSKGPDKETSSLERIQFAIDTRTLKALIEPKVTSNVRPLPPVERINFSISKKELESLVFLSYRKSEQKKKKEEQVKKQSSQIQVQPQQSNQRSEQKIPKKLALVSMIFFLLITAGIAISLDFTRILWKIHVQIWLLIEGRLADIEIALIILAIATIALYHIMRILTIFIAKKRESNVILLERATRIVGIVNGISVSLIFITPVIYLYLSGFSDHYKIILSDLLIDNSERLLKGSGFYILTSFITLLGLFFAYIISMAILILFRNTDWLYMLFFKDL